MSFEHRHYPEQFDETCPRCMGDGEIDVPGYSINPFTSLPTIDPQEERSVTCPTCRGDGVVYG